MHRRAAISKLCSALAGAVLAAPHALASPASPASADAGELVARARVLLGERHEALLNAFMMAWPEHPERRNLSPASVPVQRYLSAALELAPKWSRAFVAALHTESNELVWRRSYTPAQVGEIFFENYGYTEFLGTTGPIACEHLACGVLLLGPGVTYPLHSHEADEIYLPLSGSALWRHGSDQWVLRHPGTLLHHPSGTPHAMQTGEEPLLALYLWRSDNLNQTSHLIEG